MSEVKLVLAEINSNAPEGQKVKVIDQKIIPIENKSLTAKEVSFSSDGPALSSPGKPQVNPTLTPEPFKPTIIEGIWDSTPMALKIAGGFLIGRKILKAFKKSK